MNVTQQTMVKKAQAGSIDAFLALTEPVERKVYALALTLTHSEIAAEQVAADAIIALFRRFPAYDGHGSLETWMVRTALSEALKQIREMRMQKAG